MLKKGLLLLLLLPTLAWSREIPIEDFFKDAQFTTVKLSPDGQHIAVTVQRDDRGLLAVLRVSDDQIVGKWDYGKNNYIQDVIWANNDRVLFRVAMKSGSFDFQRARGDLYASNIDGTRRIDIPNGNYYRIVDMTPDDPDTILVDRSWGSAYLFKLNVNTGKVLTVASGPVDAGGFLVDHDHKVRFVSGEMEDGSVVVYRRDGDSWTQIREDKTGMGDDYNPLGFSADNQHVYVEKSEGGKPGSVVLLDLNTGKEAPVSSNGTVDPSDLLWSTDRKTLLAVMYEDGVPHWEWVAPDHPETKVFSGLAKAFPGKFVTFGKPSDDGRYVPLVVYSDVAPGEVYLFDRQTGQARFLLAGRSWINPDEMSPMTPVDVKARDGVMLHGYLTIPANSSGKNLPLIINPHGGPHGVRDDWGFNPEVQLLANRGYAVLQMNYRGSGGYGNEFEALGYRHWGTTMQDDLTDSVRWAIAQGIADPNRVCIYGASYGGYAALMSIEREPDLYKCSVGYVGVYDLEIQRSDEEVAHNKFFQAFNKRVQPETAGERRAQSPAYNVDKIKIPVMLVAGAKDIRVPIKNMYELIDRMKAVGKAPEDVIVADKEQHGFRDLQNNVNLYTHMLKFFDRHIGKDAVAGAGKGKDAAASP
ncbi:MAG: prolyl oligopeptidase family serine peptidase [Lysobacteraceae bacterium]